MNDGEVASIQARGLVEVAVFNVINGAGEGGCVCFDQVSANP